MKQFSMHGSMTRTHNMAFTQHHVRRRNLRAAVFAKGDGARVIRGKCYVTKDVSLWSSPLAPSPFPYRILPRGWLTSRSCSYVVADSWEALPLLVNLLPLVCRRTSTQTRSSRQST